MDPLDGRPYILALPAEKRQKVCSVLKELIFTEEHQQKLMSTLEQQINYANSPKESDQKKSNLWWGYTFVNACDGFLDGNENGKYLGLDLGGTNFRVVLADFKNGVAETTTKYYKISSDVLTGPCEKVFDQIANNIEKFIHDEELKSDTPIPLGFTFSFPSTQTSLKHCNLLTWTKTFKCTNGVGLDPCILLEQAITRLGGLSTPVNVIARIGDTTGTMMSTIYHDRNSTASVILATGSNMCIVEERRRYKRVEIEDPNCKKILVDIEWGALGDNGCCDFYRNEFEREVDKHSNHPGSYTFEKSFSGMYLGELVRLCLLKLTNAGILFGGKATEELSKRWSLQASSVANIESDSIDNDISSKQVAKDFKHDSDLNTKNVLKNMNYDNPSSDDIALVKEVCSLVSERGAYIVATALALVLKRMDKKEISVGIDGSLYENHPNYHSHMMSVLRKLMHDAKVKLFLNKDGSGEGAAFVAAVAAKQHINSDNTQVQQGGM